MDAILNFLAPLFWGLLLLSAVVFVHEGGHFFAARICGVRVTEFFLGLPCRFNLHHASKRIGTKFGVTPLLLGGYAQICGMDPTEAPRADEVLSYIHRKGTVSAWDAHEELGIDAEELANAVYILQDWASITCVDGHLPEDHPGFAEYNYEFSSVSRDSKGNTVFDGKLFDRASATKAGDVWEPPMGERAFFEQERSHTYGGQGFWKRSFMLVNGIMVNLITGFLLVIMVYSILGILVPLDINVIGSVGEGSPAQAAGLVPGDKILQINNEFVESWTDILKVMQPYKAGDTVDLLIEAEDGSREHTNITLDENGMAGVFYSQKLVRLNPLTSCEIALDNIVRTAQSVGSLLNPSHTKEVLDSSTSVIGISVLSAQAAEEGASTFLNFAALISFSLAFMNLLPIPPLDGGKLVIEAVQALTRRKASVKLQTILSVVGIVLFGLLFLYMLRADIMRFFL